MWADATPYGLMDTAYVLVRGAEAFSPAILPTVVVIGVLAVTAWQIFEHQEL
jgi:hypothetical protein